LARKSIGVIDPSQKQATLVKTYQRLRDEGYRFSIGYVNVPWGVGPRVVEWTPQPMAFYPSALHTIRLK
jgi:hypothetical protein